MRTLLLDSTFFPVRIVNWQKAMILLLTGRAEIVDEYDDFRIRSVKEQYKLPRILRLLSKHRSKKSIRFTRQNVFWRDHFSCQYCGEQTSSTQLTFDHVIPRSRNGGTNWENIVTCCHPCNSKKGCKTPEEAGMSLIKKPVKPSWTPQLSLRLKEDDPEEWFNWMPRLKKVSFG